MIISQHSASQSGSATACGPDQRNGVSAYANEPLESATRRGVGGGGYGVPGRQHKLLSGCIHYISHPPFLELHRVHFRKNKEIGRGQRRRGAGGWEGNTRPPHLPWHNNCLDFGGVLLISDRREGLPPPSLTASQPRCQSRDIYLTHQTVHFYYAGKPTDGKVTPSLTRLFFPCVRKHVFGL